MLTGYGVELARNVRDGQKNPLPEWGLVVISV